MRKSMLMKLGGSLAVCVAGAGVWTNYVTAKPTYEVGKFISATQLNQLQKNYGIRFIASPTNANNEPISAEQAVSIASKATTMYSKPVGVEATFGYMTINPNGNAVFVAPTTKAGKSGHGVVSNYPVWLVSKSNVPLVILGPAPVNQKQTKEREKLMDSKGTYDTFIDATNGERFFMVTVSNR